MARNHPHLRGITYKSTQRVAELLQVTFGHVGLIWFSVVAAISLQTDVTSGNALPVMFDKLEDGPSYERQVSTHCQYPCKCTYSPDNCKAGVPMIKDGCDCCFMCARQHGDLCDTKDLCDKSKDLYCDEMKGTSKGICKQKDSKSCVYNGKPYRDGEEFKMNCSRLCICQNGTYTCSTTCPHEERPPSRVHCKDPILVSIEKQCCKEWVCPHLHSRPGPNETLPTKPSGCKHETSDWSPCSQSCDMGWSIRVTNDNKKCETEQERRLCFIRPCNQEDGHLKNKQCRATWKVKNETTLYYGGCESVHKYMPKYCSTCKRKKCCGPGKVKTKKIPFECPDGKHFTEEFMWIKNCDCFKTRKCPFV